MPELGYAVSSEEHGPDDMIDYAVRAEETGFDFVSASDHFHPWTSTQGESPFVWSVLGAIARETEEVDVGVGVTCPTIRIHPVNVAQATATVASMLPDREFLFGVGTGEQLNEHVTGERWPEHSVRLEMLEEAIEVMRKLWAGGQTSHHGKHYTVENARLFTRPDEAPPAMVSAFGPKTASAAAEYADGFWSVGPQDEPLEAYRDAGGDGPAISQLTVCVDSERSEDEAVSTAHEYWPQSSLPGELNQVLPTPRHFEQAVEMVDEEDVREGSLLTDQDPDAHIENLQEIVDAGYDHVYVHQVGPDQEAFFELYEEEVLPSFS